MNQILAKTKTLSFLQILLPNVVLLQCYRITVMDHIKVCSLSNDNFPPICACKFV